MTEDGDAGDAGDEAQFPPPPVDAGAPPPKPTKAERLEAKAARLREQAQRRASAGTPPRPTPWIVATTVLAVVCAGLTALSIVLFVSREDQKNTVDDLRSANAVRSDVVQVAKTFALDFGSYDYRHLDTDFSEVAKRMTPSFAKNYTDTSSQLKATFLRYKTQVTAHIQGYGLTSVTGAQAVVVVFLDQTVRTSQSSTPRIDRNRLEVHLVRVKGKWLVAKLLAK